MSIINKYYIPFVGFSEVIILNQSNKKLILNDIGFCNSVDIFIDKNIYLNKSIAYLVSFMVEPLYQGNGYGKYILKNIIENFDSVILVANLFSNQRPGFNLFDFYLNNNFVILDYHLDFPIFVHEKQ